MLQTKKIIHYDTINAIKIDNNPMNSTFILKEKLLNLSKITLKSIELPISIFNIRNPYNFLRFQMIVNGVTSIKTITMLNKSYIDIFLFLTDLNNLLKDNITLNSDEIIPQFTFSSELNKLIIKTTLNTSSIIFYDEGLIFYYLGRINSAILPSKTLISGSLFLNTYTLLFCYNLSFDIYLNMHITNVLTECSNNNGNPSTFKICVDSITNTINYTGENNSYIKFVNLPMNTNLSNLNIIFYDRYNNPLNNNNYDYSFTLEFE